MTRRKNFKGETTPRIVDTEYRNCNFTQPAPLDVAGDKRGIRLFPGDDTPRTFVECNLTNCEPPPGSTVTRCRAIMVETVETDSETVTIDGDTITLQHHANYVYGRWTPGGYVDYETPEVHEVD